MVCDAAAARGWNPAATRRARGPWTADRKQPHPEVATAECSVSGIGMMTNLG
jgi:hypothetical protein